MDGINYKKAAALHRDHVQDEDIREKLRAYQAAGITYIRDGGDTMGVSKRARELAGTYGITYVTPIFAIHKKGHYGGIVGYPYFNMKEYHELVLQVRQQGGDFIKLMFSGIMDFDREGEVTEEPLAKDEIRELIHIAHEEGFAVMAHVNGARTVQYAVEAGVDSVEHGNFTDEECLQAMAESDAIWVPTYVTITNLIGSGRFDDASLTRLNDRQGHQLRRAWQLGVRLALGSDAGAYRVPHAQGLLDEYHQFQQLFGATKNLDTKLHETELELQRRFRRKEM
jgi:hypothetical protein